MTIDIILTDPFYNMRRELESLTSFYVLFSEEDICEIAQVCGSYLQLESYSHMFCSAVNFSSWFKTISASTDSVTIEDAESNEQEREESFFDQEKWSLMFVRD